MPIFGRFDNKAKEVLDYAQHVITAVILHAGVDVGAARPDGDVVGEGPACFQFGPDDAGFRHVDQLVQQAEDRV